MNQRRFHGINPDCNPTLRELLHEFDNRQHGIDFDRVVAWHRNINAWFWIIHLEPRAVFMIIKDYEATRRRTLSFPKAIGQCFGPNSEF